MSSVATVSLEDILITDQLITRPALAPDLAAENAALHALAMHMPGVCDESLQALLDSAIRLCKAGSAGVSILDKDANIFRWIAMSGAYANYIGGQTPGDFSPCGTCLERGAPQLYSEPARYFTYLQSASPAIVEGLVIPFQVDGIDGTIWIVTHDEKKKFTSEDVRIMTSLGQFTASMIASQHFEQSTRASNERFRATFARASIGMAVTDLCGRFIETNDAYCKIVGYTCDELRELDLTSLTHPDDRPQKIELLGRLTRGEMASFILEKRYLRKDGTIIWVKNNVSAIPDSAGKAMQIVVLSEDISERKQAENDQRILIALAKVAEDELRKAKESAEAANAAKDEFLAVLSHELRTPLTPVMLATSLVESHPNLPDDLRDDVATIRRNVELESRLISDLLDVTRIEKGKLQLDFQQTDLHLVIRSAIEICQREAAARMVLGLKAKHHIVHGDSTRLQQIFWNLINNAHKFTGADGTISIHTVDLPGGMVRVEVSDTGAGISADVLPRLFNAFEQGDVRATRKQAGLGLGLAITKKLVEAHHGQIVVRSDGIGHGATFTVDLPVMKVSVSQKLDQPAPAIDTCARGLRVLLVEDHEPTLKIMSRLLGKLGHRVTGATSVASALAATKQQKYDLLLSDLGLPDGSGLDLMSQIKDQYADKSIALTGYGMEQDISDCRKAGFTAHLTKPIDMQRLQMTIRQVVGST